LANERLEGGLVNFFSFVDDVRVCFRDELANSAEGFSS